VVASVCLITSVMPGMRPVTAGAAVAPASGARAGAAASRSAPSTTDITVALAPGATGGAKSTQRTKAPADLVVYDADLPVLAARLDAARAAHAGALADQKVARTALAAQSLRLATARQATSAARARVVVTQHDLDQWARATYRTGMLTPAAATVEAFLSADPSALAHAQHAQRRVLAHRDRVVVAAVAARADADVAERRARQIADQMALAARKAAAEVATAAGKVTAAQRTYASALETARAERDAFTKLVAAAHAPTPQAAAWVATSLHLLYAAGYPRRDDDGLNLGIIISHESNWIPTAVNRSDSNAAAGHPSFGLVQTIPSTFQAYALPGHTDTTDPVDQIIAGARYALAAYGGLAGVPGVVAVKAGLPYVGY